MKLEWKDKSEAHPLVGILGIDIVSESTCANWHLIITYHPRALEGEGEEYYFGIKLYYPEFHMDFILSGDPSYNTEEEAKNACEKCLKQLGERLGISTDPNPKEKIKLTKFDF
jgi:hypothetical protein